jgi:hypothetical protein
VEISFEEWMMAFGFAEFVIASLRIRLTVFPLSLLPSFAHWGSFRPLTPAAAGRRDWPEYCLFILPWFGRPDRLRRFVARTCPYVSGNPAASSLQRLRAARQGTLITSAAEGVQDVRKRTWGRHFWARGSFSTTCGNITDDVILQYLREHEPPGVSR